MNKICCFGDSNTWGYDPRSPFGDRYKHSWCDLLKEYHVQNLGMNGRTIPQNARELECRMEKDTDLLIVMLGTNDLLQGNSPEQTALQMELFLGDFRKRFPGLPVLLLAPPPICLPEFRGEAESLAEKYRELTGRMKISFGNPCRWDLPMAFDGIHLSKEGHIQMAGMLRKLLKNER